jgi:hypothetical protein
MNQDQWLAHIQACKSSGLKKSEYAKEHNLSYSQFLYWTKKLNAKLVSEFIAVKVKPETPKPAKGTDCLGVLEFPNGARLLIQSPELMTMLPSLLSCCH